MNTHFDKNKRKGMSFGTIRDLVMGVIMVGFAIAIFMQAELQTKIKIAFLPEGSIKIFGALLLMYGLWRLIKGLILNKKYDNPDE